MERESVVTRTIETTKATVKVANLNTSTIEDVTVTLPRTYKNDEAIMKAVSKTLPAHQKALTVVAAEVNSAIYGMTETDFLKYAKVMPDRKPTATADDDNTTADETANA